MIALGSWGARMRDRMRRERGDRGAMLVIALIIITVVAVVTGAIIGHGWANLRSTIALRGVTSTSYAADAAAKIAINELRLGSTSPDWVTPSFDGSWNSSSWGEWVYTNNADGTGCFGAIPGAVTGNTAQDMLELRKIAPPAGDQADFTSARVECTGVDGTGIFGGGKGVTVGDPNSTDPYANALTTTGTSSSTGGHGVYTKVLGAGNTNTVPIGGGVNSNSFVTVDNGTMTTDGFVHANGVCTGTIVSSDTQCHVGAATMPAAIGDILTTVPTPIYDAASTYPSPSGGKCDFTPGTYASGAALSTAVNKCNVAYFANGKYYFDFLDASMSDRVWNIGNVQIVGGLPTGSLSIPGSCQSPIGTNNGGNGVQFVFGGNSTIKFGHDSSVELCGPTSGGGAPLTIMQQQTPGPSATVTDTPTPVPDTTVGPASPTNLALSGTISTSVNTSKQSPFVGSSLPTTWTAGGNNYTGELDMTGFAGLAVPSTATIVSAKLSVTYTNTGTATPKIGVANGSARVGTEISLGVSGADNELKTQVQSLLASGALDGNARPKVYIAVPASQNNKKLTISAVTLTIVYNTTPPPVVTTVSLEPWVYNASTGPFISSAGGATAHPAKFVVQGATYAPKGFIDIEDSQSDFIAFRWGLVAQGVSFKTYPQQLFGYPLVSIPAPGSGLGSLVTGVDLKVYVCVGSSMCASGGTLALTTRVLITDPDYTNHPTVANRRIRVLSWAIQY